MKKTRALGIKNLMVVVVVDDVIKMCLPPLVREDGDRLLFSSYHKNTGGFKHERDRRCPR